jgi:hypothetical protein
MNYGECPKLVGFMGAYSLTSHLHPDPTRNTTPEDWKKVKEEYFDIKHPIGACRTVRRK